jgi:hypothetical protein
MFTAIVAASRGGPGSPHRPGSRAPADGTVRAGPAPRTCAAPFREDSGFVYIDISHGSVLVASRSGRWPGQLVAVRRCRFDHDTAGMFTATGYARSSRILK